MRQVWKTFSTFGASLTLLFTIKQPFTNNLRFVQQFLFINQFFRNGKKN